MRLYRISKHKYARDREGIGAKLFGARWNNVGTACIYTSESRALAVLEYASNVELDNLPRALDLTIYEAPEEAFLKIEIQDLPGDWRLSPAPQSTKDFGSKYFADTGVFGLIIPSALIPEEFNYLINPESDNIGALRVIEANDFVFDVRIKI
jgi:RES domain-containing protein